MKNIDVERQYLEACQAWSQTVSSFITYLDQLESQLPLPISKLQLARYLLHRLRPNISWEILQLADILTRRFEMEALAILIKKTTRNNCHLTGSHKPFRQGNRTQLPFCKRLKKSCHSTTTVVQADA